MPTVCLVVGTCCSGDRRIEGEAHLSCVVDCDDDADAVIVVGGEKLSFSGVQNWLQRPVFSGTSLKRPSTGAENNPSPVSSPSALSISTAIGWVYDLSRGK